MRIVSVAEMRSIEQRCFNEEGFTESVIIENVGLLLSKKIIEEYLNEKKSRDETEVALLVGRGNNGADGICLARHLSLQGIAVRCFMLFPESEFSEGLKEQFKMASNFPIKWNWVKNTESIASYFDFQKHKTIVVDAIFGTGVRLPLSNFICDVIAIVNKADKPLLAIDNPAGLCADTGAWAGICMEATQTFSIGFPKMGYFLDRGPFHIGRLERIIPSFSEVLKSNLGDKFLLGDQISDKKYFKRRDQSYKNMFGHVLILGGSPGLTGALKLAASSALRSGVGLVTLCTHEKNITELSCGKPMEAMATYYSNDDLAMFEDLDRYDCILLGPGLELNELSREIMQKVLKNFSGPILLDAGALRLIKLVEDGHLFSKRKNGIVLLTPHVGEFGHLMDVKTDELKRNLLQHMKKALNLTGGFILLKDYVSYLMSPTNKLFIKCDPNSGLAKGGSGDVLAGFLSSMMARSYKRFGEQNNIYELMESVISSSLILYFQSARQAVNKYGPDYMLPSQIIENFQNIFNNLHCDLD